MPIKQINSTMEIIRKILKNNHKTMNSLVELVHEELWQMTKVQAERVVEKRIFYNRLLLGWASKNSRGIL